MCWELALFIIASHCSFFFWTSAVALHLISLLNFSYSTTIHSLSGICSDHFIEINCITPLLKTFFWYHSALEKTKLLSTTTQYLMMQLACLSKLISYHPSSYSLFLECFAITLHATCKTWVFSWIGSSDYWFLCSNITNFWVNLMDEIREINYWGIVYWW